jgi:hypothetical protein
MIRHRRFLFVMNVLFVSLLVVASAHAAEEGGSAASEKAAEIFKWINFAIVAGFILWLCLKKAPAFFTRRASAIPRTNRTSSAAYARERSGGGTKLANLQKEVAELRASASTNRRRSGAPSRRHAERHRKSGRRQSGNRSCGTRGASALKARPRIWPEKAERCSPSSSIRRHRKRSSAVA